MTRLTIRFRLLIVTVAVLLIGLGIFGFVTATSLRSYLLKRVDDQLHATDQGIEARNGGRGLDDDRPAPSPQPNERVQPTDFYIAVRASDGTLTTELRPRSYEGELPIPKISAKTVAVKAAHDADSPFTVDSEGSSLQYRAIVGPLANGSAFIAAIPLRDIDATSNKLHHTELIAGLLVLLGGIGLAEVFVRRGLSPLRKIEETAIAISDGDLSRRVDVQQTHTEAGRVGVALNTMMDQIEKEFAKRTEIEDRLRQFVSDASHELRTPLTSIRGYAELYRQGAARSESELDRNMQRIEDESIRLSKMVEQLTTLARADERKTPELAEVEVVQLVQDAIADAHAIEPDRKIELKAPKELTIEADRDSVQQILTNLLANVRVHTTDKTRVDITVTEQDENIELRIHDDGPGMDEETAKHVFDRFYRADKARTRGGSGLGLSIVASIVQSHNGDIDMQSAANKGTTFTITLPKVAPRVTESDPVSEEPIAEDK